MRVKFECGIQVIHHYCLVLVSPREIVVIRNRSPNIPSLPVPNALKLSMR